MNLIIDSLIFIFIIALSIRGYFKGFIEEFGHTFGLIVTILISISNYQKLSKTFNDILYLESWIIMLISFIVIFLVCLVTIRIIIKAIDLFFLSQHNIWMNNLLGSIVGGIKGITLTIAFIWFISLLPLAKWNTLIDQKSMFARKSNQLKLFIISTFNLDDSIIEAESYVKKVTQP
tara:strand:- start:249 stop:776 length:528 start_codon:yes stop_codon:yes gene_type:complete